MNTSQLHTKLTPHLPIFVFLLVILQPLMDILSYWVTVLHIGNTFTQVLRMVVFFLPLFLGFLLSQRKRFYWAAFGAVVLFWGLHVLSVLRVGYQRPANDFLEYIRFLQLPLTTLCLITFLRENSDCYQAMFRGIFVNLCIVLAVEVLAALTNSEPHTYGDGYGHMGWFSPTNSNSQSTILSALVPLATAYTYGKGRLKQPRFWLCLIGGCVALFLYGTRLSYVSLFATCLGLAISIVIICPKDWKKAIPFLVTGIVLFSLTHLSPMYQHQRLYDQVQNTRQDEINADIAAFPAMSPADSTVPDEPDQASRPGKDYLDALIPIYKWYASDFVNLFGVERTMEMYHYTSDIRQITATRPRKLMFANLLMEDSPVTSRLFGLELSRLTVGKTVYDAENGFHGIYFLYGAVGLGLLLLFLCYFLYLIGRALIKDAKTYFTTDAAGCGIALCCLLAHAYFTAGVLRRPNASFYLSVTLAAIYYLTKIKVYPKGEK